MRSLLVITGMGIFGLIGSPQQPSSSQAKPNQGQSPLQLQRPGAGRDDKFIDASFMVRGQCFAGSRIKDEKAFGGFGQSGNFPRALEPQRHNGETGVYLHAEPKTVTTLGDRKGMSLLLVNATQGVQEFQASDSRLYIVQEALDVDGTWKPVEYLPSSWCGNSYHRVFLGPKEYWQFSVRRYNGKFKTKLRFHLVEFQGKDGSRDLVSNEFEGSINPEQFSVKDEGAEGNELHDPSRG